MSHLIHCYYLVFAIYPTFCNLTNVFVFPILWCCHAGDHSQGHLAMFAYKPIIQKSFYILGTCLNNV
jgi:hypothetical protein